MKHFIILTLLTFSISGCTDGDQPPDNAEHMEQQGVGSTSSSNATANKELDTNTAFNTMSTESYHQAEDPLESNSTRDARGAKNSPATPQDTVRSPGSMSGGSSSSTPGATTSANPNPPDQVIQTIENQIRENQELSDLARRVQVSGINGEIFLNGTVRSQDEKAKIEQLAKDMAGAENVTSQLNIIKK